MQNIGKYLNVRNVFLGITALGLAATLSCGQPKAVAEPTKQAYVAEMPNATAMPYSTAASMPYSTAVSEPYQSPAASPSTKISPQESSCRELTDREINIILRRFNQGDRIYELFYETTRNYMKEQNIEPKLSKENIIGGFYYGDTLIFALIVPQDKAKRAELFVFNKGREDYRSGGFYTYGAYNMEQQSNCRKIILTLDNGGPVKHVFEKNGNAYTKK